MASTEARGGADAKSCALGIPLRVPVVGYPMKEIFSDDTHLRDLAWCMVQVNYYHGIAEFARRVPDDALLFLRTRTRSVRRVYVSCEVQLRALSLQAYVSELFPDVEVVLEQTNLLHIAILEGCFQAATALLVACPQMVREECVLQGTPLTPAALALLMCNMLEQGGDISSGQNVAVAFDFLNGFERNWTNSNTSSDSHASNGHYVSAAFAFLDGFRRNGRNGRNHRAPIGHHFPYVSQHSLPRQERCAQYRQVLQVLRLAEQRLSHFPVLALPTAAGRMAAAGHCGVGAMAALTAAARRACTINAYVYYIADTIYEWRT